MPRPEWLAVPRDRRSITLAVLAATVLIVLGVIAVRIAGPRDSSDGREMQELAVGDCVTIVPRPDRGRGATGGMNIAHQEVACDTPGVVTYVVGHVAAGPATCPNPNYQEYWEDDSSKQERRRFTACLMPNLRPGTCYVPDSQTKAFREGPCGPDALFRVETMADTDDVGRCVAPAEPFNFPRPARTYCVSTLT